MLDTGSSFLYPASGIFMGITMKWNVPFMLLRNVHENPRNFPPPASGPTVNFSYRLSSPNLPHQGSHKV
jgi:hypothetical protein